MDAVFWWNVWVGLSIVAVAALIVAVVTWIRRTDPLRRRSKH